MKKIAFIILLTMGCETLPGQMPRDDDFNFEDPPIYGELKIDTLSNPDNIWTIGPVNKPLFNASYSSPNCIYTDTMDYYRSNDTSTFILSHAVGGGFVVEVDAEISLVYQIDSDTINDFGKVYFSPDNGVTWIDLLLDERTSIYKNFTFSGKQIGWTKRTFLLTGLFPDYDFNYNDTVLFKITFYSDSIQHNRQGWIIDDISIWENISGEDLIKFDKEIIKIYPNPATDQINIEYLEFKPGMPYIVQIWNAEGRRLYHSGKLNSNTHQLNLEDIRAGKIVFVSISDDEGTRAVRKVLLE